MKRGIKGEISAFPVTDILQWIEASRKTGVLFVNAPALNACLCFEDGRLLMASDLKRKLSGILGPSIPEDRVRASLERARAEGLPIIGLLIDGNAADETEAFQAVLRHAAEDLVIEVLRLPGGAFEFIEELPSYLKSSPVRLPTGGIVFEAVRRFDELRRSGAA